MSLPLPRQRHSRRHPNRVQLRSSRLRLISRLLRGPRQRRLRRNPS